MAAGTGRFYDTLAFRNVFRVCIQGSQLRTVLGIGSWLSGRALEIDRSEKYSRNRPQGGERGAAKACTEMPEKNPDTPVQRSCVD
jgi:hypothetical protein